MKGMENKQTNQKKKKKRSVFFFPHTSLTLDIVCGAGHVWAFLDGVYIQSGPWVGGFAGGWDGNETKKRDTYQRTVVHYHQGMRLSTPTIYHFYFLLHER